MNEIQKFAWTIALEREHIAKQKMQSAVIRERDPQASAREKDVYSKLAGLCLDNGPASHTNSRKQLPADNKLVTPEDAARELAEMQTKGLI